MPPTEPLRKRFQAAFPAGISVGWALEMTPERIAVLNDLEDMFATPPPTDPTAALRTDTLLLVDAILGGSSYLPHREAAERVRAALTPQADDPSGRRGCPVGCQHDGPCRESECGHHEYRHQADDPSGPDARLHAPVSDNHAAAEAFAGAEAAWEMLREDALGQWDSRDAIARHRPIIEAAIRAEGLDVDRLARAVYGCCHAAGNVEHAEHIAREYAALRESPDGK